MPHLKITEELTQKLLAGLAGDGGAYADFLNTLSPILRYIIRRKISITDSEDVLQEVLISIHKARHTYDGQRPLMPWIMAITHFRVMDFLRKAYKDMRYSKVDIDNYADDLQDVTQTIEDDESVNDILNGLGHREHKILSLLHIQGYTAKEIGLQMSMKESAVKVAAHRAIKKIREKLSNG